MGYNEKLVSMLNIYSVFFPMVRFSFQHGLHIIKGKAMSVRFGMRGVCVFGLIVMGVPAVSVAIPSAECSQCHTGANHLTLAVQTDSSCVICHSGKKTAHPIIPESQPKNLQGAVTIPAAMHPAIGAASGSKVTAEPNPMIWIPAGEFIMGFDDRMPDEGPQHKVTLGGYWIDQYEVTNAQYKKFIDDTRHRSPAHFSNCTFPAGKANHPVTEVTWNDAQDYCTWAGKRLPNDEEWEKAARGTDGRMFPWGNEVDLDRANTPYRWSKLKQEGDTMNVGSFPEGGSPYGVYDMSGNVWEWTSSWYKAYPGNIHPSENYGEQYKTLKGGSWWDCSFYKCGISAPVFNRAFFLRGTHNKSFGFRCAQDAASNDKNKPAVITGRAQ